jgi:hypothetical protein
LRKVFKIICFLLICGTAASGEEGGAGAVVRVKSFLCHSPSTLRTGSGILFLKDDSVYALTLSEAIFHGDREQKVCHTLQYDEGSVIPARLIAANFANGLALLKPEPADPQMRRAALPFSAIEQGAALLPGRESSLANYPFGGAKLREEIARILNSASGALYPMGPQMMELAGPNALVANGRPLLSPNGQLLGIVSRQYPHAAGDRPGYLGPTAAHGITGIVIPADTIHKWLDQVFAQNPLANLKEDLRGQFFGISSVPLGGILFTSSRGCDCPLGTAAEREQPIITLALDNSHSQQPWPFKENAWLDEIRAHLLQRSTVVVTGLEYQNVRYPVSDLPTTFSLIERGYRPLYRVIPQEARREETLGGVKALAENGARILEQAWPEGSPGDGPGVLLRIEIRNLLGKVATGQIAEASDTAFADLTEPIPGTLREKGWGDLYNGDFLKACELKTLLLRIRSELKKIRG